MNSTTIEQIEQAEDVASAWARVLELFGSFGVDNAIYLTVDTDGQLPFLLTTCPEVYADYPPTEDPFLVHCCTSYDFTRTGRAFLPTHPELSAAERSFIERAEGCGWRTGLGVPVRLQGSGRYGGFNLGTRFDIPRFEADLMPHAESLRFICLLTHRRIEELSADRMVNAHGDFRDLLLAPQIGGMEALSPREREVIYLVARGLSRKETARLCGISPNTVAEYVKSAYRKLGVSNRAEAAARVFAAGA